MGYSTKIQLIKRESSEQWYINFPSAVAQAMEFEKGEVVEWVIENKKKMVLKRPNSIELETKKKLSKET
jgi:antitoxin component of MazEF toxin-antitoxin module